MFGDKSKIKFEDVDKIIFDHVDIYKTDIIQIRRSKIAVNIIDKLINLHESGCGRLPKTYKNITFTDIIQDQFFIDKIIHLKNIYNHMKTLKNHEKFHKYKTLGIPIFFIKKFLKYEPYIDNLNNKNKKLVNKYFKINYYDDENIFFEIKNMLTLNLLKKAGFIMKSYNFSRDLIVSNNYEIGFFKINGNSLKIIKKLSEVDKKYNFILHFYYKLIPDYESYLIALEIDLIQNIEYDEFVMYTKIYHCNTFHLNILKEIDNINKVYNNKYKSLILSINKEIKENSANFYLTLIAVIFAITGILQTIAAYKWHN